MGLKDFNDRREAIEDEAAEWVVQLDQPSVSDEDRQAFHRWINQSPDHIKAFKSVRNTWTRVRSFRDSPELALYRDAVTNQGKVRQPVAPHSLRVSRRPWLSIAASVLVVGLIGFTQFETVRMVIIADHRTGIGEIRTVSLPDGSQVELNTDSALTLHFDHQKREVELLAGEGVFTAAPVTDEETRPFIVKAGQGFTRALGTQFVVRKNDGGAQVTGIQHDVAVSQSFALVENASSVRLSPGQSIRYDAETGLGSIRSEDVAQITAWRRGHLIFIGVALGEVIAEIDRYHPGWIVIANDELAGRQVSGVFRVNDIHKALHTIAAELDAHTVSLQKFVTVLY